MGHLTTYNRNRLNGFDNMFDQFFTPTPASSAMLGQMDFNPKLDVKEFDDHYLASFDLPGMNLSDINIDLNESQLKISGERTTEVNKDENGWAHRERSYGSFQRLITLPKNINSDKLEANYNNGVLDVLIPKTEATKARTIEVKSEPEGFLKKLLS